MVGWGKVAVDGKDAEVLREVQVPVSKVFRKIKLLHTIAYEILVFAVFLCAVA